MPTPLQYPNSTPRFTLPLLHVGQTQKEIFVNEALSCTDALLHCCIEGEVSAPPPSPSEGQAWLIATATPENPISEEWAEKSGFIVRWQNGAWSTIAPVNGMRIFNLSNYAEMLFLNEWRKATLPAEPLGGEIVDVEARAVINQLITVLKAMGMLPIA